jgi:hypothetical protein
MEGLRPLQTTPEIVDFQTISVAQLFLTSISIDKKGFCTIGYATAPFVFPLFVCLPFKQRAPLLPEKTGGCG